MKKSRGQQNNAGMSLIEIIVVVLIMGILSAGAVIGFTFIRSMDASSAAESLVAALNRTKLETTASKETDTVKLRIVLEGNNYYGKILKNGTEVDSLEIGSKGVSIVADDDDASTSALTVSTSSPCEIMFKKSNGAFTSPYTKLTVTGSKTKTVRMVNATGRSYME